MTIPQHPDDITVEWLKDHLGWEVTHVEVHEIGAGIGVSSAVYRARLTGTDVPASVVVKLTAIDPAAAFTSTVLKMYRREAAFFNGLAGDVPVRVPAGYYGEVSDDGASFVVVMEDLVGNRMLDQTQVMADADAERCIDTIAVWHANWWKNVEGMCESGVAVALSDPIYPAMLPGLFDEGWAKVCSSAHCVPPEALQPVGPKYAAAVEGLLTTLSEGPLTLLHGDFRTDNMMFDADDNLILMDFQLTECRVRGVRHRVLHRIVPRCRRRGRACALRPLDRRVDRRWRAGGGSRRHVGQVPGGGAVLPGLPGRRESRHGPRGSP